MTSVKRESVYWRWAWIIVFIGAFLRIWQYLFNRSFWNDEALLAINIAGRPFGALWGRLDYGVVQPTGFLLIEKSALGFLGDTEYALRLWPLLASILALVIFPFLARRCCGIRAALLATALFALSDRLIYFSSELRQYSSDVTIAVAILLTVVSMQRDGMTRRKLLLLAVLGTLSVWLSFSAAFVFASALLVTGALAYRESERGAARGVALVCAAWAASALLYYLLSRGQFAERCSMIDHWQTCLAPLPFPSVSNLRWYWNTVLALVRNPGGFPYPALGLFAALIGALSMVRDRKYGILFLLVAPPLFAGGASMVGMYPLFGRMMLFAVPGLFLLTAAGIDALLSAPGRTAGWAGILLLLLLFMSPVRDSVRGLFQARYGVCGPDEARPVLEYVREHKEPGDVIYAHHNAANTCEYYLGSRDIGFMRGARCRGDSREYVEEIEALRGTPRIWFVFTRAWPVFTPVRDERLFFVNNLTRIGRLVDCYRIRGGAAYLYDLSRQNTVPAETRDANP